MYTCNNQTSTATQCNNYHAYSRPQTSFRDGDTSEPNRPNEEFFGFQVRDPSVLLLDEATSALDSESEKVEDYKNLKEKKYPPHLVIRGVDSTKLTFISKNAEIDE